MPAADLGEFYRLHRSGLLRAAERVLADRAAAEDVVQETWVRALDAHGGGSTAEALPPVGWLYRVVLNLCYDRLRALKRLAPAPPATLEGERATDAEERGGNPETALLEAEVVEAVQTVVLGLPPALRDAIVLREYGGLRYRQIADALGCPIGTVMSRLHLARRRLGQALAPYLELDVSETYPKAAPRRRPAGLERDERAAEE